MQSFSILLMGRGSTLTKRLFANFLLYQMTLHAVQVFSRWGQIMTEAAESDM